MNVHVPTKIARRSQEWDRTMPDRMLVAAMAFDFASTAAGKELKKLDPGFQRSGLRLDADSTTIQKGQWITPGTVYIDFKYQADDKSEEIISESFPILVKYKVSNGKIEVKDIEANLNWLSR